jgi:diadenosine tetraphosphatase ApaH/serine/threonine PP2A family protein phosphatase
MKRGRHIFIGDIHGCFDELRELLSLVAVTPRDTVVSLGDIVRKGPAVEECLSFWRARKYLVVRGNNEQKILDWSARPMRRIFADVVDRRLLKRPELLEYIARWPLLLPFDEIDAVAVHAGILPNGRRVRPAIEPRVAMNIRHVRKTKSGEWTFVARGRERTGDRFWSEVWKGKQTVVYGHTPRSKPRMDARAIGIDTGCVYGGSLTAAICTERGEWETVTVDAKQAYAEK